MKKIKRLWGWSIKYVRSAIDILSKFYAFFSLCGDWFKAEWDGGFAGDRGCYDSMNQLIKELTTNYSDIVKEINVYQLFDEPKRTLQYAGRLGAEVLVSWLEEKAPVL